MDYIFVIKAKSLLEECKPLAYILLSGATQVHFARETPQSGSSQVTMTQYFMQPFLLLNANEGVCRAGWLDGNSSERAPLSLQYKLAQTNVATHNSHNPNSRL